MSRAVSGAGVTLVVKRTARTNMASRGKKKTTFAKLAREAKLRERRVEKQARKDARKRAVEFPPAEFGDTPSAHLGDVPPAELGDTSSGAPE
jgi:hypothetical protein